MAAAISVIVPVCDEERSLLALFDRLYAALDRLAREYEIIFVDDGSRDESAGLLRQQFERRPECTRVVFLAANAGQDMAILAGFERARGTSVITLADLRLPPEEIAQIVNALDCGADYVGDRLSRIRGYARSVADAVISAQVCAQPRYMIDHVLQPKPDADDELPASLRAGRRPI